MRKDYYAVLGLERNASEEQIKKAYKKAALAYHPDRNPGDDEASEKFKRAAEAYEVLGDPQKKAEYDQFGSVGSRSSIPGGFGFPFGFGPQPVVKAVNLVLEFIESIQGCEKEVEIKKQETSTCPDCNGSGRVQIQESPWTIETSCNKCRATGQVVTPGGKETVEKIKVRIPPGICDGMIMQAQNGASIVHVHISVKTDKLFQRHGDDLVIEIPTSYTELVFGTSIDIPTIDGEVSMRIPKGTQPNTKLRLRGKGVPNLRSGVPGDQLVVVKLEVPKKLDKEHKEILEKLKEWEHSAPAKR